MERHSGSFMKKFVVDGSFAQNLGKYDVIMDMFMKEYGVKSNLENMWNFGGTPRH